MKNFEAVFDVLYLSTVFAAAVVMLATGEGFGERRKFGLAALILALGDACHLVPRILNALRPQGNYEKALGMGKLAASLTMTVFYALLWNIGAERYGAPQRAAEIAFYSLAALRIVLCLVPLNRWSANGHSVIFSVIRNLPFAVMGGMAAALFFKGVGGGGGFAAIWALTVFSFLCYLPVVLFAHKYPKTGMLMLPKSLAYCCIVLIGAVYAFP